MTAGMFATIVQLRHHQSFAVFTSRILSLLVDNDISLSRVSLKTFMLMKKENIYVCEQAD
jgi:hypothetical protein